MQIKVKTLTGKEIEIDIEPSWPCQKIKEALEEKEGIPPQQQKLIFGGKAMPDDKTAEECKVVPGSVLHLVLTLRGGGRSAKMMKRPTKAEKVSRAITKPVASSSGPRPRSVSPDIADETPIAIPLFNTSAERRGTAGAGVGTGAGAGKGAATVKQSKQVDEDMMENEDDDEEDEEVAASKVGGGKKASLKDKVKAIKQGMKKDEGKTNKKLGVLGGTDYLKLHEKRPGGAFRKKFR